jgi:Ribbon-helix-helix protein, copG family
MTEPFDRKNREPRTSIRIDARLDATTRAKVDELAQRFQQPRAAVVCHIMHWGLSRGQAEIRDGGGAEGPVRHLYLCVDTTLHARVEQVASAAGMKIAPWLRAMMRQITTADFPASWVVARSEERSHDSQTYGTRFMLRLDEPSLIALQKLVGRFGVSKAEIIRQLIIQARNEDFPPRWHMRSHACSARQARQESTHADQEPRSRYPALG